MTILKNNQPIGFFDSGVGGLTVLKEVKKILPKENFVYFGDTVHVPYGDKTKEQLLSYSKDILDFFTNQGCKAVVMACNTTSSMIYDDIKDKYDFKLYPVVQFVAKILAQLPVKKLGIFATKATIHSNAYSNEIHKYNPDIEVFGQYCPHWVKIVENNLAHTQESINIIKSDLDLMLKNKPEKIVLGCTHYPYLLPQLSKILSEDIFIDPAPYFAQVIKSNLEVSNLLNNTNDSPFEKFYVSSEPEKFKNSASMFYEINNMVNELSFSV